MLPLSEGDRLRRFKTEVVPIVRSAIVRRVLEHADRSNYFLIDDTSPIGMSAHVGLNGAEYELSASYVNDGLVKIATSSPTSSVSYYDLERFDRDAADCIARDWIDRITAVSL